MEALHALNPRQAAGLKRPRTHVPLLESTGATTTTPSSSSSSFRPLGTLLEERAAALSGGGGEGEVFTPLVPPPSISADCKSWGLHSGLARALESEGVAHFFPVQRALIPLLLAANSWDDPTLGDVCVSAPTGSGKTLAYALPLLHSILTAREGGVRGGSGKGAAPVAPPPLPAGLHALIVLPTRDLAVQVHAVLVKLSEVAAGGSVRVLAATGQASFASEQAALESSGREGGVDILVASPGRLMDHLDGTPALTAALRGLRVLVVDEADRLLAESYQDWVRRINLCIFKAEDPGVLGAYLGGWEGKVGGGGSAAAGAAQEALKPMHLSRVWRGEGSRVGGVITALSQPTPSSTSTTTTTTSSSLLPPWMQSALPPTATTTASLATPDPLPAPYRRILCSATLSRNPQKLAAMGLWHPYYITASGPAVHATTSTTTTAATSATTAAGSSSKGVEEGEEELAEGGGLLASPAGGKKVYTLPSTLHQALCVCSAGEKTVALHHILKMLEGGGGGGGGGSAPPALCALVFTNSVDTAHRLTRLLQLLGGLKGAVVEFSATLSQSKRTAVLTAAAAGAVSVLVASDAAARGLDLPALPAVIHYDVPSRTKTYVHRVGRAARAGREGVSYTLLRPDQVRHFKGLLQRTRGAHTCIKETLPKALVGDYAGRVQECLTALKGVLEEEAAGTLKASKAVEALGVSGDAEGGAAAAAAGGGSDE